MSRETPSRDAFVLWQSIPVRAADMDARRHVNNGAFIAYFEVARRSLFESHEVFDAFEKDGQSPVMVAQGCTYLGPLRYPATVDVGLVLREMRARSFTFDYGAFRAGSDHALAYGHSTHAWFSEGDDRSVSIPDAVRGVLTRVLSGA